MHQAGRHVVVARGDEDFAVSHRPWTELLDSIVPSIPPTEADALETDHLRALAQALPSLRSSVGSPANAAVGDIPAQRALVLDAILAVLRVAGPTVLILDDLHWFDAPSLGVLRRVVSAAIPDLTIVGAYRDTDITPVDTLAAVLAELWREDGVRRLALDGIDAVSVVALVERSSGRPLDAATISLGHAIHARTAGNPLFAGELISHLEERPQTRVGEDKHSQPPETPLALSEIIGRRLARLGDDVVGVLRIAAAVGERFDVSVVEATVELERSRGGEAAHPTHVLTHLERARSARVVVDDVDGMSFRHAIIRAALLEPMSAGRQRLHRDIATVLEQRWSPVLGRNVEVLAIHHDRAHSPDAPRWYQRAATAAAQALDTSAADLAERGLELLANGGESDPELWCDLLIAKAVGLRLAGRETIDDARRATEAAIALADQDRIAAALLSLSVRTLHSEAGEHLAFLATGLAHLTDDDRVSHWRVAAELTIRTLMVSAVGDAEHARKLLDVVDHLDPADVESSQLAMRCAAKSDGCEHGGGRRTDRRPLRGQLRRGGQRRAAGRAANSTMWLHLGDRAASDRHLERASRHPQRRHWLFDCQVRQRQVLRHLLDGHWSAAATGIEEIRTRAVHDNGIMLGASAQQDWLQRETDGAERTFEAAQMRLAARPGMPLLQAVLASDATEVGRFDVAASRSTVWRPTGICVPMPRG